MEIVRNHKDLDVWRLSMDLAVKIYNTTQQFPKDEIYGLVSQMRRCAVSIPANIAEGSGRAHSKELCQFLNIASGSAAELESLLIISNRLNYIDSVKSDGLINDSVRIIKMLASMSKKIKSRDL